MRVREILEKAAYKTNIIRTGASISGEEAVHLCGLLDDILAELSADNFFNCRTTMITTDGRGKNALTIGEVQPDGTTPDIVAPRPYNLQSVSSNFGSGWMAMEETDLADIGNYTFEGSSGHPEFFAYEESYPFGMLHFNRGASCNLRLVYSIPFPQVTINGDLPIPRIYSRALVLTLAHAMALDKGMIEDAASILPEMEKAQRAVRGNTQKSKPLRLEDSGFYGYGNVTIMGMR